MKFAFPSLLSVLLLGLVFGGCEKTPPAPPDAVLFQAIQDNVSALDKKDIEAVMGTIHPSAPTFDSTRSIVSQMFQALDLKYTLSDLKVVTSSPDEAQVSFVQKTEKQSGDAPFQSNIVEGVHTLRPDGGKWKIYRTVQTKVTDLEGKPLGTPDSTAPAPEPPPSPAPSTEPPAKPATPAEKPAP